MKKISSLVLVLILALSLVACGGSTTPTTKAPANAATDGAAAAEGTTKADGTASAGGEKIVLGFSQVGSESEFRTANTNDVRKWADLEGVDLQFSDAQQKQENQIRAIRSFIASEVDVIAFVPIVNSGWETVLQEAKDAGIPVMLVDRGVTADESLYVTRIGMDTLKEGADAFNWIDNYITKEKKQPRQGDIFNIVILEGTVGSSVALDRLNGFKEAMAASANAGKYEIILSQTGEYTRAKGKEVMESFLRSAGDKIDILFAANDDMALGAIQAIEAAGLKPGKDIIIVSIDAAKGAFNAMIEGKLNAAVEHNPLMGQKIMEIAKKIAAGETVDRMYYVEQGIYDQSNAASELPNRQY